MTEDERGAVMLRVWPWMTRLAIVVAVANLVLAIVVKLWGPSIHPMLVEPHTWLLLLVTGLSLSAQAALMRYTLVILRRESARRQAIRGARGRLREILHRRARVERHPGRHRRVGASAVESRFPGVLNPERAPH